MVKSSATSQTELASNAKPVTQHPVNPDTSAAARSAFTSAAIGMSWQLAIIVLLPIIGGYKLDQANGSLPLWTIVGLLLAFVGSILVIRKALRSVNHFDAASRGQESDDA